MGHFKGMGETGTVMISFENDKHLGFVFQTAESGSVNDAIPISLESSTAIGFIFGVSAAATGSA